MAETTDATPSAPRSPYVPRPSSGKSVPSFSFTVGIVDMLPFWPSTRSARIGTMQERTVALAIDLGGTKVDAALVDADGDVVEGTVHRAPTGRQAAREHIEDAVRGVAGDALADLRADDRLVGIGVGSAGPVDLAEG